MKPRSNHLFRWLGGRLRNLHGKRLQKVGELLDTSVRRGGNLLYKESMQHFRKKFGRIFVIPFQKLLLLFLILGGQGRFPKNSRFPEATIPHPRWIRPRVMGMEY